MALKYVIDNANDLPEAVKAYYKEQDGRFVLDVDGVVPKEKLEEFRSNNIRLSKEREELAVKFNAITTELQQRGATQAEMDAAIQRHQAELADSQQRERQATQRLRSLLVERAVNDAALEAGVLPAAMVDVSMRAHQRFDLNDQDKVIARETGEFANIKEWVNSLKETAPHYFPTSGGGGSPGNTRTVVTNNKVKSRADLATPADKARFIREHGIDAYLSLPTTPGAAPNAAPDVEQKRRALSSTQHRNDNKAFADKNGMGV